MAYLILFIVLATGRSSQAEEMLKKGEIDSLKALCEGVENQSYFIGEVHFFQKDFDSAVVNYRRLPASSVYTNDALFRILIINQIDKEALKSYVDGELAISRQDHKKARNFIRAGIEIDSSSYSYAALLLSRSYATQNEMPLAIQVLLDAVNLRPSEFFAPYLLKEAFFLYRSSDRRQDATEVYDMLRVNYPDSPVIPILEESIGRLSN